MNYTAAARQYLGLTPDQKLPTTGLYARPFYAGTPFRARRCIAPAAIRAHFGVKSGLRIGGLPCDWMELSRS